MIIVIWILLLFWGFLVPILICVFAFYAILGDFMGAPFVPTQKKMVEAALKKADLKKGQIFLELGSGDGRVVHMAVEKYGVKGLGVEMHPLLVLYSNIVAKIRHLDDAHFKKGDFFKEDLSKADVIFLFLLPETLIKLRQKLLKEGKKNTQIISHGFKIKDMEKNLSNKIERKLFSTYFYKI